VSREARRLCRLSEASTPLPILAVEPPENTLFNCKRNLGGGNKKINQRIFLVGRAGAALRPQASGLSLRLDILLEMGSSFVVKSSH
jgi:hypothetical protein